MCAELTAYAAAKGAGTYLKEDAQYYLDNYGYDMSFAVGSGYWWLRSPGNDSCSVVGIDHGGMVWIYGNPVDYFERIRPALKVAY